MAARLHFISGLPRAGSTLLAAILRQNPAFRAGIQSPLADVFRSALQAMSGSESALFIDDEQRERVLRGICESFYGRCAEQEVVFDTHRYWCGLLPAVAALWSTSRMICCLRNPAWILDSMERLVQRNPLRASKVFNYEIGTAFTRAELLATKQLLAPSLQALRQAWFSEDGGRLVAVRYESLVERPAEVIAELYSILDLPSYPHRFDKVDYEEPEFDDRIGMPGMHRVSGPIAAPARRTILPPEIFSKHEREFWVHGSNPNKIPIL